MKVEEAIKQLKELKKDMKKDTDDLEGIFKQDVQAIETVLQELKHLQKENEEYSKQLDLDYVDKNFVSKDKIREKIEEIKARMNDDCLALHEFQRIAKIDVLQDLLKEE